MQDRFGSADVLELREVPDPVIGEGEALVRARAAGCGPDVWHVIAGPPCMAWVMPEAPRQCGPRAVRAPST